MIEHSIAQAEKYLKEHLGEMQDFKYIQVKIRSNNFEERVRPIKLDKNIL